MGGSGSGRKHGADCTDDYLALDVRRWQGSLFPGRSFSSYWTRRGEIIASVHVETEADRVILNYRHRGQPRKCTVYLDTTPCNYGGARTWFKCPHWNCGRRVAVLYRGSSGGFVCRHCLGLAYRSQRETEGDRADRAANKVRRQLGWMAGIANPTGSKPKGMHWRTYRRLFEKHNAAAMKAFGETARCLGIVNERLDRIRSDWHQRAKNK